jgi:hypothetical protein
LKTRDKIQIDLVELFGIALPFLFIIIITIYHILGNPKGNWSIVWALSENMLLLSMSGLIILLSYSGIIRNIFKYIFNPYFCLKCIYHICCYLQIRLWSAQIWKEIWVTILILSIIVGVIIVKNKDKKIKRIYIYFILGLFLISLILFHYGGIF